MAQGRLFTLGTHRELAASLARELGQHLSECAVVRAPDGEAIVGVDPDVVGEHVVFVHPTFPSGGERILELLLAADACRRVGARSVSAVIPYVGYARQEHRTSVGDALGMRVVGEILGVAKLSRVMTVDMHAPSIEGFFPCPVEHLTATGELVVLARRYVTPDSVVVAPDLGAAKMARDVARALELPFAILHKSRRSTSDVSVDQVVGSVQRLRPIIVDDMITSGGTIAEAVRALRSQGCATEITVLASHALLVGPAVQRLTQAGISRLIVSDSLPTPKQLPFPFEVAHLAPVIASALRRTEPSM